MNWTTEKKIRYLDLAQHVSQWSKDPSTKIGAVAVVGNGLPIIGYNGFPRGMRDTADRLNDRTLKYPRTVHAEMNCIYNAADLGVSLRGASMFVYGLPVCGPCSLGVVQAGVKNVFIRTGPTSTLDKWVQGFQETADNFEECGVYWEVEVPRLEGPEFLPEYKFR